MRYVIGLTGNIGSGKSTVLRMLERLGAKAIDADALVHEVMRKGTPVWRAIVDSFGQGILTPQGRIHRKKLGSLVFNDHEALGRLEQIIHPAVDQRFTEIVQGSGDRVIAVEAVKIIDSEIYAELNALWVVTCPPEEALERLAKTGDVNEEDIKNRLAAQMPAQRQAELADVIIDNGGTLQQTWEQVKREWDKIQQGQAPNRRRSNGPRKVGE